MEYNLYSFVTSKLGNIRITDKELLKKDKILLSFESSDVYVRVLIGLVSEPFPKCGNWVFYEPNQNIVTNINFNVKLLHNSVPFFSHDGERIFLRKSARNLVLQIK